MNFDLHKYYRYWYTEGKWRKKEIEYTTSDNRNSNYPYSLNFHEVKLIDVEEPIELMDILLGDDNERSKINFDDTANE